MPTKTEHIHAGEVWVPVAEAAERLNVDPQRLHKRIASKGVGRIEGRRLGADVCIAKADVDRMAKDGLPHPDWERYESGELIPLPDEDEWLTGAHPWSAYGPSGYVALIRLNVGTRHLMPGDVLIRGEESAASLPAVASLPLGFGIFAMVRKLQARVHELEEQLAAAKVSR
jgi:hypothetical protein